MTEINSRLAELTARAEQAKKLADDIAIMKEADPYRSGIRCTLSDWGTSKEYLGETALKEVINAGRLRIIKNKTAELESLLSRETGAEQDASREAVRALAARLAREVFSAGDTARTECREIQIEYGVNEVVTEGHTMLECNLAEVLRLSLQDNLPIHLE